MVGIFCCLYVIFPDSIHLQVIVLGSTTVCFSRQFYTEHHDTNEKNIIKRGKEMKPCLFIVLI